MYMRCRSAHKHTHTHLSIVVRTIIDLKHCLAPHSKLNYYNQMLTPNPYAQVLTLSLGFEVVRTAQNVLTMQKCPYNNDIKLNFVHTAIGIHVNKHMLCVQTQKTRMTESFQDVLKMYVI